jgi:LysM repeat protein
MPEITLSIPVVILIFAILIIAGGGISYLIFGGSAAEEGVVPEATTTLTPTATLTPTPVTPTATFTAQPSPTPLTYVVQSGDLCGIIASTFNVSVRSIILQNGLDASCTLAVGQTILIPQPTPTNTPAATSTLTDAEATRIACNTDQYVVQTGETLSLIATIYEVSEEAIMEWNGLTVTSVFAGQRLEIPLCLRGSVGGATVTPTVAPPYPAPELLLPLDGEYFSLEDAAVVLQWSSVGALRANEAYQITVINVTTGEVVLVDEVVDTSYLLPDTLRPSGTSPEIFRWYVVSVAQIGTDEEGNPIWIPGGPASNERVFSWSGSITE